MIVYTVDWCDGLCWLNRSFVRVAREGTDSEALYERFDCKIYWTSLLCMSGLILKYIELTFLLCMRVCLLNVSNYYFFIYFEESQPSILRKFHLPKQLLAFMLSASLPLQFRTVCYLQSEKHHHNLNFCAIHRQKPTCEIWCYRRLFVCWRRTKQHQLQLNSCHPWLTLWKT